jgi:hypothetical protein
MHFDVDAGWMLIQEAVPLGAERVNVLMRTIQAGPAASEPLFAIVWHHVLAHRADAIVNC